MQYTSVKTARFLRRPNRFLAVMELGGQEVLAHVPNTGRCRELLIPGTRGRWYNITIPPAGGRPIR